ncbi:ABC transporter ATP-binding protein [Alkalihalobacillus sp. BA299]|uniref:ABC transporter ATP-binding protein n=1 Tax=Alkalihalobacillus sp. BA299 TaxID=2815938 RepID=UPI001ADC1398|nr:ABC transporter ATP-binding protein [Alkalihalobacillus sp. BA299]
MLKVNNISSGYGEILAIRGINIHVENEQIVGLIGPNGAGKTTLLKTIIGFIQPTEGTIMFDGKEIQSQRVERIVSSGMALVPEGREILATLTVQENLELGAYCRKDKGIKDDLTKIYDYFPILKERRNFAANTLSGGQQQMLSIGRALMSRPKLLLLDEPSMGLAPIIVDRVFEILKDIQKEEKISMLIVEQNTKKILELSEYSYVLRNGEIIKEGPSNELIGDPQLVEAYL